MRAPLALTIEASLAAIEDVGLDPDDIDGISTYPGGGPVSGFSEGGTTPMIEALRLQPTWINGGGEMPGQIGALVAAMLAVAAGLCRHVLVYRTGWEATYAALQRSGTLIQGGGGGASGIMEGRLPFGAFSAANWIAMAASQHFSRYGTTRAQLGAIALNARRNAALNPNAVYTEAITMEDYLAARLVSTPFGPYDCDVPCDVLWPELCPIVTLRGIHVGRPCSSTPWVRRLPTESLGIRALSPMSLKSSARHHLWTRTSLTPGDVDVAELYDGFTFNCLSWIEALGFCGIGEGGSYVEGGTRIALDGDLQLNTNGGQLSGGRLHGFGFIHEAVMQLRGHAGPRQVPGAEVVVVGTGGGVPAAVPFSPRLGDLSPMSLPITVANGECWDR